MIYKIDVSDVPEEVSADSPEEARRSVNDDISIFEVTELEDSEELVDAVNLLEDNKVISYSDAEQFRLRIKELD